jgi:lysophospholipase L1-like esterase
VLYFNEVLERFKPDAATFAFGTNDSLDAPIPDDRQTLMPQMAIETAGLRSLLMRSNLVLYVMTAVNKIKSASGAGLRVAPDKFHKYCEQAKSMAAAHGCKLYFIAPTALSEKGVVVRDERYLCEPLIDPTAELNKLRESGVPPIFASDKVHPTEQGHEAIAKLVAGKF